MDIAIFPKEVVGTVMHEGIEFSSCTFIEIFLDGASFCEIEDFEGGVVVWDELKKSAVDSGKYLIFTCYCGIPEDGGWDFINVTHLDNEIIWEFDRVSCRKIVFNKADYISQINDCGALLRLESYPLAMPVSRIPYY
ncbi:hypothetical protein [Teredinibacter sp. KSP-S5-2]|uniref:hypothetical protein n=1 Tax=Teredinibacter sp. KSP-S5-2 TaxID=3034506 RepID=UPI00293521C0|nr:hypothetical protein [Teredinibacter sp. KSP-S5-2]WNO09146.1 hypothetical protein P5V12_19580 [Teredinibacter sp. KSP-S5-2]